MNKYEVGLDDGTKMEVQADSWRGFGRGGSMVIFYNEREVPETKWWRTKTTRTEDIVLVVTNCRYIKTLDRGDKS